jgi:hypothetical protein
VKWRETFIKSWVGVSELCRFPRQKLESHECSTMRCDRMQSSSSEQLTWKAVKLTRLAISVLCATWTPGALGNALESIKKLNERLRNLRKCMMSLFQDDFVLQRG